MKSRRSASRAKSRPKRTTAWRPSVSTSSRSVVTSTGSPAATSVTVPCSMPVGMARSFAALARAITAAGRAVVATSMSPGGQAQQGVAHGAAHQPRLLAVAVEQVEHAGEARVREQRGVGEASVGGEAEGAERHAGGAEGGGGGGSSITSLWSGWAAGTSVTCS